MGSMEDRGQKPQGTGFDLAAMLAAADPALRDRMAAKLGRLVAPTLDRSTFPHQFQVGDVFSSGNEAVFQALSRWQREVAPTLPADNYSIRSVTGCVKVISFRHESDLEVFKRLVEAER